MFWKCVVVAHFRPDAFLSTEERAQFVTSGAIPKAWAVVPGRNIQLRALAQLYSAEVMERYRLFYQPTEEELASMELPPAPPVAAQSSATLPAVPGTAPQSCAPGCACNVPPPAGSQPAGVAAPQPPCAPCAVAPAPVYAAPPPVVYAAPAPVWYWNVGLWYNSYGGYRGYRPYYGGYRGGSYWRPYTTRPGPNRLDYANPGVPYSTGKGPYDPNHKNPGVPYGTGKGPFDPSRTLPYPFNPHSNGGKPHTGGKPHSNGGHGHGKK